MKARLVELKVLQVSDCRLVEATALPLSAFSLPRLLGMRNQALWGAEVLEIAPPSREIVRLQK